MDYEEASQQPQSFNYNMERRETRGMTPEQTNGVMKDLIDTEKVILSLDYSLKGMAFDPIKGEWRKITEPYLNDELRFKVITAARSRLNPITLYANIDDPMIEIMMESLYQDLVILLFKNPSGITSNNMTENDRWARARLIIHDVTDAVWIGLTQPKDAGQRKMIEKTSGYSETNIHGTQEKKRKKLLGLI